MSSINDLKVLLGDLSIKQVACNYNVNFKTTYLIRKKYVSNLIYDNDWFLNKYIESFFSTCYLTFYKNFFYLNTL